MIYSNDTSKRQLRGLFATGTLKTEYITAISCEMWYQIMCLCFDVLIVLI